MEAGDTDTTMNEMTESESELLFIEFDPVIGEKNKHLGERIEKLKHVMNELKYELQIERDLWKQEVEEAEKLRLCVAQTTTSDEKALSICSSEPTLSDMSLLEYEDKLAVYQEALSKAHAEKRMNLRRHLAATAYKKRLLEVENMCNMELMKVKQNIQCLQPLQAKVSSWSDDTMAYNIDDEILGPPAVKQPEIEMKKLLPLTMDNLGDKINDEIKDIEPFSARTQSPFGTALSLMQEEEDEEIVGKRFQSVNWYTNDIPHFGYNHQYM